MSRHGDYFDEPVEPYRGGEILVCQDGPFRDFDLVGGYHYGQLASGPDRGGWVRLEASPADMGLIRDDEGG